MKRIQAACILLRLVESFPNGGGVRQIVIFKRDHRSKLDTKHISKRKANNLSFIRISSV